MLMQLRWAEADLCLIGLCASAGLVFGATWGSVLWIFWPRWGLEAGFGMGAVVGLGLYLKAQVYDPDDDDWDE
jgi:hypothetical protein